MEKTNSLKMAYNTSMWYILLMIHTTTTGQILFPFKAENSIRNHSKIHWSDFQCFPQFPHFINNPVRKWEFESLSPTVTKTEMDGYLCSREKWVSTCYENLFGHQTKTFKTIPISISYSACNDAIDDFKKGVFKSPIKPDFECSWLAENSNSRDYILVRPYSAKIDHYDMYYKNHLFLGGKCKNSYCETHYDNIIWIPESHHEPSCPNKTIKRFTLYFPKNLNTKKDLYIEGDNIPIESLQKVCKGLHYCNEVFYLTSYGHGFKLPESENIKHITDLLNKSPRCQNRLILKNTLNSELDVNMIKLEDSERFERCLDTVEKAIKFQELTRRDLSHLHPTIEGNGIGFRIENNTIYKATVDYILMIDYRLKCQLITGACQLEYQTSDKKEWMKTMFNCTFDTHFQGIKVCDWFNGILIYQNSIQLPKFGLLNVEIAHLYTERQRIIFDQHVMLTDSEEMNISGQVELASVTDGNLLHYMEESVSSTVNHAVYWVISVSVIILLLLIAYRYLLPILKKRSREVINQTQSSSYPKISYHTHPELKSPILFTYNNC